MATDRRPNILWLSCEDIGPHIGCYGDPQAITPHIDELARQELMQAALTDQSSAVRTAAAPALCRMGQPEPALPVLIEEMTHGAQWERLYAAIVLDEIDQQARPVLEQMKRGLEYQEGFNSDGKYRVRVINRALNELLGTDHRVR